MSAARMTALHNAMLPFIGYAKATQPVKIMVHLPLRNRAELQALVKQMSLPGSALYHKFLTPQQFAARYAPLGSDMQSASAALRAGGLTVTKMDRQFIYATAPASTINTFFGTRMGLVRDGQSQVVHVDARTPITVPASLTKFNAKIIGLTGRSMLHPTLLALNKRGMRFPRGQGGHKSNLHPTSFFGPYGPYFPGELLQAYGEPAFNVANGYGTSIAIVGFSDSTDYDNQTLWCYYGLGPGCSGPSPNFPTVNHFENPGSIPPNSNGSDSLEASLDAQIAGGSAPGATIDQYASDAVSNFGFLDTYAYIANDSLENYVTTSYSECELFYFYGIVPFYYLQAYDDTFLQGAGEGISWNFSSGDNGALGCAYAGDYEDDVVSAFAADPNVTGVGGTTLLLTTSFDSGYGTGYNGESSYSYANTSESPPFYWGSGGGFSYIFETPDYQQYIGIPDGGSQPPGAPFGYGRLVPDVSMHMGGPNVPCPPSPSCFSADWVYSSWYGGFVGVIGTSAASPEFAGYEAELVTGFNAGGGGQSPYLGNANYIYYETWEGSGFGTYTFNQYICGDNFAYSTGCGPGYNEVTGLGTPNFESTLSLYPLNPVPAAGDTFTASNP